MTSRNDPSTLEALRALEVEEVDRYRLDRRRFLQLVGMGAAAGTLTGVPTSWLDLFDAPSTAFAAPVGPTDGIVVVIGMYGGNDGLNTVVPFNDGHYYDQRGALAIKGSRTLQIAPGVGLHPALTELKGFWDRGQLAVIEGIGYPNPDLSHFSSMAYWMSGQPRGFPTTGWIGRWLDAHLGGAKDLYAATEVGSALPLHMVGRVQRGTAVPAVRPDFGGSWAVRDRRSYDAVRAMHTDRHGYWHARLGEALVDHLDVADAVTSAYPQPVDNPGIGTRLEVIARLINAHLGFRVLTAGWPDFDSHAGQPTMHDTRMAELNAAIGRFYQLLDPVWATRVVVMTFSEFGRTPWGNDGAGTDHGTAAPHFVFGQNVRGGVYGQRPALAGLRRWDRMAHHVDYRSYYSSVIDGWLGGGASEVFGAQYEDLGLFRRGPGRNPDGSIAPAPAVIASPSSFVPVQPFRLVDTRDGTGNVLNRALGAGEPIRVPITGQGSIPAHAVSAVAVNVTAVDVSEPNFFTVYPGSTARPFTSNLNAGPGRPVPNLIVMGVGADGCIEVFNSTGSAHCLVDVFGYFTTDGGDRFVPVAPSRLFDTRDGLGIRPGKIPDATPVDVQVAGLAGVPPSGASAVVMNLTITEPESDGWMRATPSGQAAASTSNVNFSAWDTVPNMVICKLGDGGRVTIDGRGSGSHVIGDVFGYFTSSGGLLRTLPPRRILDTREGWGAERRPVGPANEIRLVVAGQAQVPAGATAVVLNVTATNVAGNSFVTVWPDGERQPTTSSLNVTTGQTIANLVICRLGTGGALRLASPIADCDLIADVLGYFSD